MKKKINIGIDASRNKSGGAKIHLIGILNDIQLKNNINEVHVWSYNDLLNELPDFPWLKKHCSLNTELPLLRQLYWQNKVLPKELKKNNVDIGSKAEIESRA